jgi:hypothetical protein
LCHAEPFGCAQGKLRPQPQRRIAGSIEQEMLV